MYFKNNYVYMYGMVMSTMSLLLCGDFPKADGYGEVERKYHLLGGETGTACAVLCSLGVPVKLGGTHLGNKNRSMIENYFSDKTADTSELAYEDYDGVIDYVIIDKNTRTCFGEFGKFFSREKPFYEPPSEESVKNSLCVGADPFFGESVAELCVKYNKPYATIDCRHDSYINAHCEVNAVSHQYLDNNYDGVPYEKLFEMYTESTDGLVIFTLGEKGAMYGRKGQKPKYCDGFKVDVVSTLGAGDSFKAGTVYGLYKGMNDDELVKCACAVAACACSKFPISLEPPTVSEVEKLIQSR